LWLPLAGNAAVDPQTPASSKLVFSLAAGIGVALYFSVGGWRLLIGHHVASCFQMVSRLEGGREVVERAGVTLCLRPCYLLTLYSSFIAGLLLGWNQRRPTSGPDGWPSGVCWSDAGAGRALGPVLAARISFIKRVLFSFI
jgi:hypothetical protein